MIWTLTFIFVIIQMGWSTGRTGWTINLQVEIDIFVFEFFEFTKTRDPQMFGFNSKWNLSLLISKLTKFSTSYTLHPLSYRSNELLFILPFRSNVADRFESKLRTTDSNWKNTGGLKWKIWKVIFLLSFRWPIKQQSVVCIGCHALNYGFRYIFS